MMATEHIVNVNEMNFEYEVVAFSQNIPVLVDFWAEWCQPCKVLAPLLEKIVHEAGGSLRLAKVNIDQNPNLALQYNVRSIPTVKAFIEGRVAAEFAGVQPEARLMEFVNKLTPPSPMELDIEKGQSLLLSHEWDDAENILRKVITQMPDSPSAQLGLAKALLGQNQSTEALELLKSIPSGREYTQAQVLLPYAECLLHSQQHILPEEQDLDAIFRNSIHLASQARFPLALDGFLDILRQDKRYRNDLAKQCILAILEILGDEDPQTREYRSELASVLF